MKCRTRAAPRSHELPLPSQSEVRAIADALASPPLSALNYSLILLDDCWSATTRSNTTGQLQPDPARFPSGIPALVNYVSARGLTLGLYTCAGTKTCKYGRPGSAFNYELDAQTLVGWGVRYSEWGAVGASVSCERACCLRVCAKQYTHPPHPPERSQG